jgi:hypothetical protein
VRVYPEKSYATRLFTRRETLHAGDETLAGGKPEEHREDAQ